MHRSQIILILVLFISMLVFRAVNIPNINPSLALVVFFSAWFTHKKAGLFAPLAALLLSDIILSFTHPDASYQDYIFSGGFILNYLFYFGAAWAGQNLKNPGRFSSMFGATLISVLIFFLGSNLVTFFTTALYTRDFNGLITCYSAALPFLKPALIANLTASIVLTSLARLVIKQNKSAIV